MGEKPVTLHETNLPMKTIKLTEEELELLISDTETHLEMVQQYRKSKGMHAKLSFVDEMRVKMLKKLKDGNDDQSNK